MIDFNVTQSNEKITSNAGLVFVAKVYEYLGLDKLVNLLFPKPGSSIGYPANNFVLSLILMMIGGGEALDHTKRISEDNVIMKLLGIQIAKPGNIAKWLFRVYEKAYDSTKEINNYLIELVLSNNKRRDYTFDPDATGIESKKKTSKKTYKGYSGYMPMLGFLAEVGLCIVDGY